MNEELKELTKLCNEEIIKIKENTKFKGKSKK